MRLAIVAAVLACGLACAGGEMSPGTCKLRVQGVQEWNTSSEGLNVTYRVTGEAGSPGLVWLVANPEGANPIPGGGVDVGPGPFAADVSLKLTGVPRSFAVLLEVQDPTRAKPRRCKADANLPAS